MIMTDERNRVIYTKCQAGMTYAAIADEYGLTKQRIVQIYAQQRGMRGDFDTTPRWRAARYRIEMRRRKRLEDRTRTGICRQCSGQFYTINYKQIFCCRSCKDRYHKQKNGPASR
jgi:hypothetical protein